MTALGLTSKELAELHDAMSDPRRLVERVSWAVLLDALAGGDFGGLGFIARPWEPTTHDRREPPIRFRCPRCEHLDANGGTALSWDRWTWACANPRCQRGGARPGVERMVVEDRHATARLYRLVGQLIGDADAES